MNLEFDPSDEAFRQEVRAFLKEKLPPDMAERNSRGYHQTGRDRQRWTQILAEKGWSAQNWPVEYGGTGFSHIQQLIYEEEAYYAGAPFVDIMGFKLVGPVIYTFGTEEQKRRFLGPIRRGEISWGQGFSEPNAGSDLASLTTRADRDGDHYVINGRKIWTSEAQYSDYIFALVKTDPPAKQRGISFMVFDSRAPGVTIRPIIDIGEGHSLNEVIIENVRTPVENLIGEPNKGWTYAKFLLENERAFNGEVPRNKFYLQRLKKLASLERDGQRPLIEEPIFASRIAQVEAELHALEWMTLRTLAAKEGGAGLPYGSILKVRGTELQQKMTELQVEALGDVGAIVYTNPHLLKDNKPYPPGPDYAWGILADFFYRRATTIYGGSNEVQKNILAKTFLGL